MAGDAAPAAGFIEKPAMFALVRPVAAEAVAGDRRMHDFLAGRRVSMAGQTKGPPGGSQTHGALAGMWGRSREVTALAFAGANRLMLVFKGGKARMAVGTGTAAGVGRPHQNQSETTAQQKGKQPFHRHRIKPLHRQPKKSLIVSSSGHSD
jgi:hypothetical protein